MEKDKCIPFIPEDVPADIKPAVDVVGARVYWKKSTPIRSHALIANLQLNKK